jgi:hypothetical protein
VGGGCSEKREVWGGGGYEMYIIRVNNRGAHLVVKYRACITSLCDFEYETTIYILKFWSRVG